MKIQTEVYSICVCLKIKKLVIAGVFNNKKYVVKVISIYCILGVIVFYFKYVIRS